MNRETYDIGQANDILFLRKFEYGLQTGFHLAITPEH